jgi:CRISPR-associated protein Csh1
MEKKLILRKNKRFRLYMIKEICQFVDTLENQIPDLFEDGTKLKEGIYAALDIGQEDGRYVLKNVDKNGNILKEDIGLWTRNEEINPFFEKLHE